MATGDYCSLAELKARLWPSGETPDTTDDAILAGIITAASRQIDEYCGRRFWTNSADETRYFTPDVPRVVFVDDIVSITSLTTDREDGYSETWTTSDYILLPGNAAVDDKPYTWIVADEDGDYVFRPRQENDVKIVGKFGWPVMPQMIKQAALIQSVRLWNRINAPFGVTSNPVGGDMQTIPGLDPDFAVLLGPFVKRF